MGFITLNNWCVKNNELSISLFNYDVYIRKYSDRFVLIVCNKNYNRFIFLFNCLEDSIVFTEEVVANSFLDNDIFSGYQYYCLQKKLVK